MTGIYARLDPRELNPAMNDDSISFDEDNNLVEANNQPSEFDKWLENYDKEYEDPSLEAAARRQVAEESLSFSL